MIIRKSDDSFNIQFIRVRSIKHNNIKTFYPGNFAYDYFVFVFKCGRHGMPLNDGRCEKKVGAEKSKNKSNNDHFYPRKKFFFQIFLHGRLSPTMFLI